MKNYWKVATMIIVAVPVYNTGFVYGASHSSVFTSEVPKLDDLLTKVSTQLWGDWSGTPFTLENPEDERIEKIIVNHGRVVSSLEFFIRGASKGKIGGDGGRPSEVIFDDEEFLVGISGRGGVVIDRIRFHPSTGRVFGPFGGIGGTYFSFSTNGKEITSFFGTTRDWNGGGPYIGSLGVIHLSPQIMGLSALTRNYIFFRSLTEDRYFEAWSMGSDSEQGRLRREMALSRAKMKCKELGMESTLMEAVNPEESRALAEKAGRILSSFPDVLSIRDELREQYELGRTLAFPPAVDVLVALQARRGLIARILRS